MDALNNATRSFRPSRPTSAEAFAERAGARRVRPGEYRGRCPSHNGKSQSSLSIRDAGGRALLYCFAGCSLHDILNALGLSVSELYDGSVPDPARQRLREAQMGFDKWRDDEGQRVARELRERDLTIQIITDSVHRGVTTEAEALEQLGDVYAGYSYLEHKFHILRCGAQREALEVYRDG